MIFTVSAPVVSVSVASVSWCIIRVKNRAAFRPRRTSHMHGRSLLMRERTGWQVFLLTKFILALFFILYRTNIVGKWNLNHYSSCLQIRSLKKRTGQPIVDAHIQIHMHIRSHMHICKMSVAPACHPWTEAKLPYAKLHLTDSSGRRRIVLYHLNDWHIWDSNRGFFCRGRHLIVLTAADHTFFFLEFMNPLWYSGHSYFSHPTQSSSNKSMNHHFQTFVSLGTPVAPTKTNNSASTVEKCTTGDLNY